MSANFFDARTAIFLAAVCIQTYRQFKSADGSFILPRYYRLVSTFKASSFIGNDKWFGFIIESEDKIVVAFRGTYTTSDWISDIIAKQIAYPYVQGEGWVHQGFLDIYHSARKSILTALNKISAHKRLYIAGHSLGGGLTSLCAVDIAANTKFKAPIVYSYASPRVGNPAFANQFNRLPGSSFRIYNVHDIVPQLPPIIYKSPRTDHTYHYIHVKKGYELSFQKGSVSANHSLDHYFSELSKLDPAYTKGMCARNPRFCPN